jgi:hypothetical protein
LRTVDGTAYIDKFDAPDIDAILKGCEGVPRS